MASLDRNKIIAITFFSVTEVSGPFFFSGPNKKRKKEKCCCDAKADFLRDAFSREINAGAHTV